MLRAFLRAPSAVIGLVVLVALLLLSILAPALLADRAIAINVPLSNEGPSTSHLLGTDQLGRDIFIRLLVATRLTLGLALAASGIGAVIGMTFGALAAILPGRLRTIALRAIDATIAFPAILVAIFTGAIVGPGAFGATLGVGIGLSFGFARVASALALSIAGRDYVAAARVLGIRGPRLLMRYVLPNMAEPLAITSTVSISSAIVAIAALSFLGLGVQPPQFDWGSMLTAGVKSLYVTPAAAVGPMVAIAIGSLASAFIGEAVARAMNPLLWARINTGQEIVMTVLGEQAVAMHEGPDPKVSAIGAYNGTVKPPSEVVAAHDEPNRTRGLLEVRELSVSFPGSRGDVRVVEEISFTLQEGDIMGIVGESGSGKTMTAMAIAQLVQYPGKVTGSVSLNGHQLRYLALNELDQLLGTKLSVVFQDPMTSLNPALRIGRQMTERVEVHEHMGHRSATELAASKLGEVNIPAPARTLHKHPHELSGGMRQRVMIAMGLMTQPSLLIADEPTTALDVTIQAQIMDLLAAIQSEHGMAIVLISHNIGLVSENCNRILVMYAGRIVEDLNAEQLRAGPKHPYTAALLAAVPDVNRPRGLPLASIPGQAPEIGSLVPGCAYHPRCALAVDKCQRIRPLLRSRPDGSRVACHVANQDLD